MGHAQGGMAGKRELFLRYGNVHALIGSRQPKGKPA